MLIIIKRNGPETLGPSGNSVSSCMSQRGYISATTVSASLFSYNHSPLSSHSKGVFFLALARDRYIIFRRRGVAGITKGERVGGDVGTGVDRVFCSAKYPPLHRVGVVYKRLFFFSLTFSLFSLSLTLSHFFSLSSPFSGAPLAFRRRWG